MTLTESFASLIKDADDLKAALAAAGVPQHVHAAYSALHARLDAMALDVAAAAKPAEPKSK